MINSYFTVYEINGIQIYFSNNITQILGYKPDELIGKTAYDYFNPLDIKEISKAHSGISSFKELSVLVSVTYRMRHKDEYFVWVKSYSELYNDKIISLTRKLTIFEILIYKKSCQTSS